MINADGKAVAPSLDTFKAAASDAKWKPSEDYELILTNQPGTNSWPINATTFILLPKNNPKNMNQAILSFFTWNYTEPAAKIAKNMDYIAIPQNVITGIKAYWKKNLGYGA
jgi:phosphate transport system substrate-binding protein